jgi:uncharacterized repeat protein (TIGR03833 family)
MVDESKYDDNYLELLNLITNTKKSLNTKIQKNSKNIEDLEKDIVKLEQQKKIDKYKQELKLKTYYNVPQGGRRQRKQKSHNRRRKSPNRKRKSPKRRSPRRKKSPIKSPPQPNVGDHILIIIKPYSNNVTVKGIVKRVLTKRKFHSRGHKVELRDGTIGRTVEILKK